MPNATSAMALLNCYWGDYEEAVKLIEVLRQNQENGNWQYSLLKEPEGLTEEEKRKYPTGIPFEDDYHLAMMIYHLKNIKKISNIHVDDILTASINKLIYNFENGLIEDRIGWFAPMAYAALKNLNNKYYNICKKETIKNKIFDKNFRIRAMSA